ncbi:kinesin-like protein KIF13A isoform X2 [Tigriopus californicus]|uniref:kinesin-like protein KIF13A isoform X2 n=1 Tax=Tigriopus californicus TaxID=6832 RepID=UPI0027D9DE48|nr:kinesin-like protein KIF13A isoform X2 [Tigriopus californicus]
MALKPSGSAVFTDSTLTCNDKIKVAVRVRPFNDRERSLMTENIVEMDSNQTFLHAPNEKNSRRLPKVFAFDHCFNSNLDLSDPLSSDQEKIFSSLGLDILDNAFDGYNACIFAYGQTGSGKSYSMMGSLDSHGIIPRLCNTLFERISAKLRLEPDSWQAKVEVSYMEIYNEKVHDLLDPKMSSRHGLKVREHIVLGPYVDGLSQLAVVSYLEIEDLMIEGNKSRTVASTNMNSESSRSHAVFNVILTQTLTDQESGVSGEKVSKISLVDLAGSERAIKTGAVGERLKEGSNINKSLTTLGLVISKLADQASGCKTRDKAFVPYRDSTLTWLLKDNLGGNSKTVMIATISPSSDSYEETLSTLRYADRTKRIVNHAVVNEDPNARIIRELRAEVDALKEMLKHASQPDILREKLCENEKLMKEVSLTWEEKLQKTGQTQEDRRQALEKVGISIQASGIKVQKDKFFLVNLNSDPSLNELLVYYLKDFTRVGRAGDPLDPDIQLSGVGIQPEHCSIQLLSGALILTPISGARTCVNGFEIKAATKLANGDRILWGSNHYFRVNCPNTSSSDTHTPRVCYDWKMAQEEVLQADLSNDPIRVAIARLERQHEEDKYSALQKQRIEYEKQFQQLKNYMSPSTPFAPYVPHDNLFMRSGYGGKIPCNPIMSKLEKWGQERDENFKRSLSKLREDIMRANSLTREANLFSEELGQPIRFSVTLQIPPQNLSPNRKRGSLVSEPAILVKRRGMGNQIWSVEKLNGKLIEIRSALEDSAGTDLNKNDIENPFNEGNESHCLIGVANVFLSCLQSDVKFDYFVPIISQQGVVSGRLHIQIERASGIFPDDNFQTNEIYSTGSTPTTENNEEPPTMIVKVTIKNATGLPPSLSNYVFCMYNLWGEDLTVVPSHVSSNILDFHSSTRKNEHDLHSVPCQFEHEQEFAIPICDEFIEHCYEGALSVEVYGHRSLEFVDRTLCNPKEQMAKARSLADRWSELSRKLALNIEVQELDEVGEYAAVEVQPREDVGTGGVFQLRQGQQRKLVVTIKAVQNSGTLPIICDSIISVSVGCPLVRSKLQKPLDSYQDEDLNLLRKKWTEALERRREYLDSQIQKYWRKSSKSEDEIERERSLVEQWVGLTEERNSVMVPIPGSGVPGAPADWEPPDGVEQHCPVLFLDLIPDDLSTGYSESGHVPIFGNNSILPKEHGGRFLSLPIIAQFENEVGVTCSWDSSIHDSLSLNKVTPENERAYVIVKTVVRLSHPTTMDLVLRKRICFNVFKRHSLTDKIRRKMGHTSSITSLGVIYEIVSNIPKASEELEDRESLAVIAASGLQDDETSDGESFIEKYTKGVSAVETILALDRLRQSVVVKELVQAKNAKSKLYVFNNNGLTWDTSTQHMRKTMSVPNFGNVSNSVTLESTFDRVNRSDLESSESIDSKKIQQNDRNNGSLSAMRHSLSFSSALRNVSFSPGTIEASIEAANNGQSRLDSVPEYTETSEKPYSCDNDSIFGANNLNDFCQCITQTSADNNADFTNSTDRPTSLSLYCNLNRLQDPSQETVTIGTTKRNPSSNTEESCNPPKTASPGEQASNLKTAVDEKIPEQAELGIQNVANKLSTFGSIARNETLSLACHPSEQVHEPEDTKSTKYPLFSTNRDENGSSTVFRTSPPKKDVNAGGNGPGLKRIDNSDQCSLSPKQTSPPDEDINTRHNLSYNIKFDRSNLPSWVVVGESVQVRPSYSSGVISYVGITEFAAGLWVGITLDAPTGKNDGSVQGVRYFKCGSKRGVFVKPEKVQLDKRGRSLRRTP